MKKIITLLISTLLLSSCGSSFELNNENVSDTYIESNRSINLSNKGINSFVNLNNYLDGIEVNNIFLSDNNIERLDISGFDKLGTLDISNNEIRFISDLNLPLTIRHLNLAGNKLSSLSGISKYTKLKTLDVSGNNLSQSDIDISGLDNLLYLNINDNINISQEKLVEVNEFNKIFLSNNPVPFSE